MEKLLAFSEKSGRVSGLVQGLPEHSRNETIIDILVSEAIKTSEIEGEFLSRGDVMSSIRNNLNLTDTPMKVGDKRAEGVAEMVIAARRDYQTPLTKTMLFEWHRMLLRAAYRVKIGAWRTHSEPMQVVSGAIGKQIVHYEAPPSSAIPDLMGGYVEWFNDTAPQGRAPMKHVPVRAGIAHLYFETIHPFEDGNGRIGRAISEKSLSQGLNRPTLIALAKAIENSRKKYYAALQIGNRGLNIQEWMDYFCVTVLDAQDYTQSMIDFLIEKSKFYDLHENKLNERQAKAIARMCDEGIEGFKGGLSAENYIAITGAARATATRDLQNLVDIGALKKTGELKYTRYFLNMNQK
jgi:Fic family protein